jgi:hypothetical protein
MMILYNCRLCASLPSLPQVQIWAMERLMSVTCASGDIRWAMLALVLRAFSTLLAFGPQ